MYCSGNRKACTNGSYPRLLISTRLAVGAVLYLVEILGCKVFRRHGQLLQNASARLVQTLAFCSYRALVSGSDKYISALRKHKHIDIQHKRINRCR